jgi:hypothetical protein
MPVRKWCVCIGLKPRAKFTVTHLSVRSESAGDC